MVVFLSQSNLLYLAKCPQDPSMLLQMARFYLLWLNHILMYVYHIFFIHLSIDGHLLHVLAIVNKASVNVGCICLFKLVFLFFLDKYPEVELLVVLFLIF